MFTQRIVFFDVTDSLMFINAGLSPAFESDNTKTIMIKSLHGCIVDPNGLCVSNVLEIDKF